MTTDEKWREHRTAEVRVSNTGRAIRKLRKLGQWEEFRLTPGFKHHVLARGQIRAWTTERILSDIEKSGAPWFPLDVPFIPLANPDPAPEPDPEPAPEPDPDPVRYYSKPRLTPAALNLLGIETLDAQKDRSLFAAAKHACPVCNSPVAKRGQNCGSWLCKRTLRRGGHKPYHPTPKPHITLDQ